MFILCVVCGILVIPIPSAHVLAVVQQTHKFSNLLPTKRVGFRIVEFIRKNWKASLHSVKVLQSEIHVEYDLLDAKFSYEAQGFKIRDENYK